VTTVYLDSNALYDVLDQVDASLFASLQQKAASGDVTLIASDLNLTEALSGNHLPNFTARLQNLLSLSPKWLLITGLAARQIVLECGDVRRFTVLATPGALLTWAGLLPLITDEDDRAVGEPGIHVPTAAALLSVYQVGTVKDRLKKYWQPELSSAEECFRTMLAAVRTCRNIFWKTVAATVRKNFRQSEDCVKRLWDNPDLAPAFRLEHEFTCRKLSDPDARWTTNDFLDNLHAGAITYVDLFLTKDQKFLNKLSWYDTQVRIPRGLAPYAPKICRSALQLEQQL
jgi:hypothetical protein